MAKLQLDYQQHNPFPWVGAFLVATLVIVIAMIANYFLDIRIQANELETKLERAYSIYQQEHARKASNLASVVGTVNLPQEVKNANAVLHRLSVPWDDMFKAVEASNNSHVTLLSLVPDVEKKQVLIRGEADNYSTIMKYITSLEGHDIFSYVYLRNHDVKVDDPDKPVRFTLLAHWQEKL
jgi:Fimbrial assembly protein (PilN)